MNYLAIVQMACRESRVIPVEPTTIVNATGKTRKLIIGVNDVYKDLQIERDWAWMHREFGPKALQINVGRYTSTGLGLTRFGGWAHDRLAPGSSSVDYQPYTVYDSTLGVSDEAILTEITYQEWRVLFGRGQQTTNRPTRYAISPINELLLGPYPDKSTYLLNGEYQLGTQDLLLDGDTPEMPADLHQYLAWSAITRLREGDEAPQQVISAAINNAARIKGAIMRTQTEGLTVGGGPIA